MTIYHLIIVSNGDWSLMRVKESDALGVSFKSIESSIKDATASAMLFARAMNLDNDGSHTTHIIQAADDDDAKRQARAIIDAR